MLLKLMKRLSILCYILVALFVVVACDDSDNKEETTIIVTTPTEVTLGRYATEFELCYEAETAADASHGSCRHKCSEEFPAFLLLRSASDPISDLKVSNERTCH